MFKYQSKNTTTGASETLFFETQQEADAYAIQNSDPDTTHKIIPMGAVDGIMGNEEDDEEFGDFDEEDMGLDEESREGFDYTLEDKSGD